MNVYQRVLNIGYEDEAIVIPFDPDVFLIFISPTFENTDNLLASLEKQYPHSILCGCSTSGEIHDQNVSDHTAVITAISFDKTKVVAKLVDITDMKNSEDAGRSLASSFDQKDLAHLLVFSDGLNVNGADLVKGLVSVLPNTSITGGLAGDGSDFNQTFIISGGQKMSEKVIALGLYSNHLKVGFGSKGGWDSFGIDRKVTKSKDNVLFELDGKPALEVYKTYLGDAASELPSSGLLFPLSLRDSSDNDPVVRTILAVSEEDKSLTFAGNIPEGSFVKMMKANINRLVDGAEKSAEISNAFNPEKAELSLLISCVGRRLVLKQLVEEEIEAVKEVVGDQSIITGFYSYGEIAPFGEFSPCRLHNQTMTITTLSEV